MAVAQDQKIHTSLASSWRVLYVYYSTMHFSPNSSIGEVGGYGARIGSHFDSKSNSDIPGGPPDYDGKAWAGFITQGTLLLIGPLFFAATIYMILGRTIRLAGGEGVSVIRPKWCTRIFVASDVSTLIIQALGTFQDNKALHEGSLTPIRLWHYGNLATQDCPCWREDCDCRSSPPGHDIHCVPFHRNRLPRPHELHPRQCSADRSASNGMEKDALDTIYSQFADTVPLHLSADRVCYGKRIVFDQS
jgi:hypothetical protein